MPHREKRRSKNKKPATFLSHKENPAQAPPLELPGPYDLSIELEKIIARLATLEEFNHIRTSALMIAVGQCKNRSYYGTHASLSALRFPGGKREFVKGKNKFVWPQVVIDGYEKLYHMTCYLPRFLDVDFDEKLKTIIHELYHISPRFNGDLRRFPGKNYAHGHSLKDFEKVLEPIKNKALEQIDFEGFDFLTMNFNQLRVKFGSVVGNVFRDINPKRYSC